MQKQKGYARFISIFILVSVILIGIAILYFLSDVRPNIINFSRGLCTNAAPSGYNSYYVDPEGRCAPCSDSNSGAITSPWCTIGRAFQKDKPTYLHGGEALYLRGGVHRYDMLLISFNFTISYNQLTGSASRPTIISGYPGEDARIYGSERVKGWQKSTSNGQTVWFFNWFKYLQQTHPWFTNNESAPVYLDSASLSSIRNYTHVPGAVYIDDRSPLIPSPIVLPQANVSKTLPPSLAQYSDFRDLSPRDYQKYYFSGYKSMPQGYVYYENDPKKTDFGILYLKLPSFLQNQNPNNLSIEVPLQLGFYFGWFSNFHSHVILTNFSFRYTNGLGYPLAGGLDINGDNNVLSNLNISYNPFVGLFGKGYNNTVAHSTFSYNGNVGTQFLGDNLLYDSNIFAQNSKGHFSAVWAAGGAKLIPGGFNITFRNNLFYNNSYVGLWFDYTGDGRNLRNMKNSWDAYEGAGHLIENNTFINGGLALETSPGSEKNPNIVRNNVFLKDSPLINSLPTNPLGYFFNSGSYSYGAFLMGVPYTYVYNNLFYNLSNGVTVFLPEVYTGENIKKEYLTYYYWAEANIRRRIYHTNISNNIFVQVGIPISLSLDSNYSPAVNYYPKQTDPIYIDSNVYFGGASSTLSSSIKQIGNFTHNFQGINLGYPCCFFGTKYDSSCGCPVYIIDSRINKTLDGIKLSSKTYQFFRTNSIDTIQNTPFFKRGINGFHPQWDVFPYITLDEWQNKSGFDIHSKYADPILSFPRKGIPSFGASGILDSIQFDSSVGSSLSSLFFPVPACTEYDWSSEISPSLCPSSGSQARIWTKIGICSDGVTRPSSEVVSCSYGAITCTDFDYTNWSACNSSGVRSRQNITALPVNCQGGNPLLVSTCAFNSICNANQTAPCDSVDNGSVTGYKDKCNSNGSSWTGENTCYLKCNEGYTVNFNKCTQTNLYKTALREQNGDLALSTRSGRLSIVDASNGQTLVGLSGESISSLDSVNIFRSAPDEAEEYVIIQNLKIDPEQTKTIYLLRKNLTSNGVCIRDEETSSLKDLISNCTRVLCPGKLGNYSCLLSSNFFLVEGLHHSGVREITIPLSCGDGICTGNETCSSCAKDCGVCRVSSKENSPQALPQTKPENLIFFLPNQVILLIFAIFVGIFLIAIFYFWIKRSQNLNTFI